MRIFALGIALLMPGAAPAGPLDAPETHAFAIVDQQLGDVLREFSGAAGVAVDVGRGVEGRVTNFTGRYTARGFLDAMSAEFGLVWYDDGAAVHVTGAGEMRSVVIDFDRVAPDELRAALDELGVADERFALRETRAGIGVVTGPPRYVELVENAFLMLAGRGAGVVPAEGGARPSRSVHAMTVVRGESVAIWRGAAATEAAALAEADPATPGEGE